MKDSDRPIIPRAMQVVIDDLGVRHRVGDIWPGNRYDVVIDRQLEAADYETIARIGREAGTQIQLAMLLCLWDRDNVCANYPSTQWLGRDWDNRATYGPWVQEAAQVFADNPRAIEFAMHGVAHDYYIDGRPHVGEWCDRDSGRPWPTDDLQGHIDCFRAIVAQTGLDTALPYPIPRSFVPCYFVYYLDDGEPISTGALMARNGLRYASTPRGGGLHAPGGQPEADGGFDSGILLLIRDNTDVSWNQAARVPPRLPRTSICGMHWGNFLAQDAAENDAVADRWIAYLRSIDREPGLMLATDTEHCWSQWVYHTYATTATLPAGGCTVDLSRLPARAWDEGYVHAFTLEIPLPEGRHISAFESAAFALLGYRRTERAARLTLIPHGRKGGALQWQTGVSPVCLPQP